MKNRAEWLNSLHLCGHISGLPGAEGHIETKKGSKQHSVVKLPEEAGGIWERGCAPCLCSYQQQEQSMWVPILRLRRTCGRKGPTPHEDQPGLGQCADSEK